MIDLNIEGSQDDPQAGEETLQVEVLDGGHGAAEDESTLQVSEHTLPYEADRRDVTEIAHETEHTLPYDTSADSGKEPVAIGPELPETLSVDLPETLPTESDYLPETLAVEPEMSSHLSSHLAMAVETSASSNDPSASVSSQETVAADGDLGVGNQASSCAPPSRTSPSAAGALTLIRKLTVSAAAVPPVIPTMLSASLSRAELDELRSRTTFVRDTRPLSKVEFEELRSRGIPVVRPIKQIRLE